MQVPSLLIGFSLCLFGVLKLLGGHRTDYALPELVFYGVAGFELIVGALAIVPRTRRIGLWLAMALAAGFVTFSFVHGEARCGCLGMLGDISNRTGRMIGSSLGLLAAVALVGSHGLGEPATATRHH